MLNTVIFFALRVVHVLAAATWIGSTAFIALMLAPAVERAGASGGQVMARIDARGFQTYMALLATTTVLTGLYLIWRFTGGFDGDIAATHAGVAFALGGAAGVLALIVGGAVVARSARQATELMTRAASMPDNPEKSSLMVHATAARRRMKAGTKVVIALQAAALVLMTIGHYV
jgi:uncharacterized membrane protein